MKSRTSEVAKIGADLKLKRARWVARVVGLAIPLLISVGVTVTAAMWIPRMPDPAAVHWGISGGPDGFGSPWTYVWLSGLLGGGLVLMMWAIVEFGGRSEGMLQWSPFQRFLAAFAGGFSVFLGVVILGSMGVQLGLSDAADASGIGGLIALAFCAWIVATGLAWFVQPKVTIPSRLTDPSEPLDLAESERAIWIGYVRPSRLVALAIGGALAAVLAATIVLFVFTVEPGIRWVMLGVFILLFVLAATTLWFRVRIDSRGVEARSALGWPTFRLDAAEVARVDAAPIAPLAEFGGWGLRWGPGRFGIVMRAGEGIVATRHDGRIFALTVDDSQTAAALLAASAERARGGVGQ